MAYKSLSHYISALEKEGELIRITEYVNPELEITEITDRISKQTGGGKALLFENTGTDFPLLINAFGSEKRMSLALGTDKLDDIADEIKKLFDDLMDSKSGFFEKLQMLPKLNRISSWMPKSLSGSGECQEIVHREPDISALPVLKCWHNDGGKFITLPMVNTIDPVTGIRNVGMYRMQIFDKNLTGMHWHLHKTGARHYDEYKKQNKKMPVAVVLGGDPAYTYSATAPLPDNFDEYMFAGFLRKKKVELVKCITQDIEVPADADIIIEGYVDPDEDLIWEGPFGDHTGFYSLPDWYPKFHITCITHKKEAVYPATIVGIPPQEDAYIAKATERIFLPLIKLTMLPELNDMDMPVSGVAHNLAIANIDKRFHGQGLKVMNTLWGAGQMMFNKILVVVDKKINVHNYQEVAQAITNNVDPQSHIVISEGVLDILDHAASKFAYGGKMAIDATVKNKIELRNEKSIGYNVYNISVDTEQIIAEYPEIKKINADWLQHGISLVIIAVEKQRKHHIKEMAEALFQNALSEVKFAVFLDSIVDIFDLPVAVWIAANNTDPKRDSYLFEAQSEDSISHIAFDATRKTKQTEGFSRDWPNVVTADEKTIETVNEKWHKLGLGELIESPSLKFKACVSGTNAIAD